ncbi:SCP2 sterol-binding domain-containing protein [Ramlibacter tataouinensis]|uniref:ubiquinone anaerobic biosynthesis accessory factor UbiT n=1 Tax=Ramlibacter tataouinensis TaxID=94132 RepID=UPI0022F37D9B|nr:SCP2 sterol-binding domain-containing protein [Ramlibacter tataouinensis]WBY03231.1 SCP2 sterol-binding domain-containing protein [Ramlibacter tataouinensis]
MAATELRLPECPAPIAAVLQRLPSFPASLALATALNVGLAPQLPLDVSERLRGKRLRIGVRDARVQLDFTWDGRRFKPLPRQPQVDLAITASGPDFLRLAQRTVDADMLFFDRRLSMEGDTELGLIVKNTLDALERPLLHGGWPRRGRS